MWVGLQKEHASERSMWHYWVGLNKNLIALVIQYIYSMQIFLYLALLNKY
jgi:hypothetical protein